MRVCVARSLLPAARVRIGCVRAGEPGLPDVTISDRDARAFAGIELLQRGDDGGACAGRLGEQMRRLGSGAWLGADEAHRLSGLAVEDHDYHLQVRRCGERMGLERDRAVANSLILEEVGDQLGEATLRPVACQRAPSSWAFAHEPADLDASLIACRAEHRQARRLGAEAQAAFVVDAGREASELMGVAVIVSGHGLSLPRGSADEGGV